MLPQTLISRFKDILGSDYDAVMKAYSYERNGFFRINSLKATQDEILSEFHAKGITVAKYDKIPGVFTFQRSQEYAIKGTKAFYDGKIYLQSLASILPVLVLNPQSGEHILDVCAAPGSKTTQMAMMMGNRGNIIAIEQNQIRYDKLMYNCRLQGATIVEGVKMDARKYVTLGDTLFDKILLDAPCSAEGRIHLPNEKSYGFWTLENIAQKSELQYELLELAFAKLKNGGTLVYSTCTLAPEENEGVIAKFLKSHQNATVEAINIGLSEKSWWKTGINEFGGEIFTEDMRNTVRILPSEETEGFFIAKIMKK